MVRGLLGGGGTSVALPLLLDGAGLAPHEAIGTNALGVAAIAIVLLTWRTWSRQIRLLDGTAFALPGLLGIAIGARPDAGGRTPTLARRGGSRVAPDQGSLRCPKRIAVAGRRARAATSIAAQATVRSDGQAEPSGPLRRSPQRAGHGGVLPAGGRARANGQLLPTSAQGYHVTAPPARLPRKRPPAGAVDRLR